MSNEKVFKGGVELKFFEQQEFESLEGVDASQVNPILARNILRLFTMGWTNSWTQFLNPVVLYSFFLQRDINLLKEIRLAMQQGFLELFSQLQEHKLSWEQAEQVQLYLSNCLSMLPYGDPTPYEAYKIPQYIENHWELIEYQITPIELTERNFWKRPFTYDHDRVFAYGLKPMFHREAESHLIFMGTTYPAGQGFLTQIKTDSKGFESVGFSLYRSGRERIHTWLCQQKNPVHVCGVSLGGALSLLLALDKGDYKLSRVDALNPPGLFDPLFKSRYDFWEELAEKPRVVVQKQGNDPVSAFGIWKPDWEILQVIPPKDKQGPNAFWDHCLNYAGFADTEFKYISAEFDNAQRKTHHLFLNAAVRSFIYYYVLVPFNYTFRPLGYFMVNKLFPQFARMTIPQEFSALPKIHHPALPRIETMDIYNEENAIEIELSYQQINTYYQVMRGLLRNKNFIPNENKENCHVQGMTKKDLLTESTDSKKSHLTVFFKVTKAKASHIIDTLNLVRQFGIDNKEKIKYEVEKNYELYRLGKH
ncbi:hypothetical protein OQJ18_02730 [Fluoribacter dumoffii]|uniref:Uncharacterized protein n=1 Tax=Fluoribacter dumoffii TaxID=463 RepID=A0A377GB73_9GAMM|nr:hypothetical protein [Fluoribacter dumoffii]KTC88762.1 hypothetical protein Ldum_3020 [Fluoribacter dumoffii NY 23]MCW8385943.1 hypothetical protein [Fluoribacter dumoffii]MCW8418996.1 hypothetical protein [Fluoribacter dumoffii]MCW8453160.1 hypothetical protein [Fluoribacter dumoffii]MCW8459622.1 hypothetical protein [Fluoribacter dumoffii]